MNSKSIFYRDKGKCIEDALFNSLKNHYESNSVNYQSPRTAGDAFQQKVAEEFPLVVEDLDIGITNYSDKHSRRAMADLSFEHDNHYYIVDVKSHDHDTVFNMPNLTSVERLSRFYREDSNNFTICVIEYSTTPIVSVNKISLVPIEFLSWECLTFGALGWGQVQIANSNRVIINKNYSRKSWMIEMCDKLVENFYPSELVKIDKRVKHFNVERDYWYQKEDLWS